MSQQHCGTIEQRLGAVHKRRVQSEEGLSRVFEDEGILQMGKSAFFGAINFGFFEIYGASARTRELSQCGHFSDKEGSIFRDFVRTPFMLLLLLLILKIKFLDF